MNTNGLLNMYIVQKGDSVQSICDKFKISEKLFYRYNQITKYAPLKANMPVYIVSFTQAQIVNMDLENDAIAIALASIAYLIKECIISSLYLEENLKYDKMSLHMEHERLVGELSLSLNQKSKVIDALNEVTDKLLEVVPILLSKDKEGYKTFEKEMREKIMEYTNTITSINTGANKELLVESLTKIMRSYVEITIRLIMKKYEEVYDIFNTILKEYELINKNLLLH